MDKKIIIKGARENNLKSIDLEIPRNKLVCFIGVSGSGKSTIAFDIIAKEGERQYFESLSSFARRYLSKSNKPDVDFISGISASILISQDRVHHNPRSTVGTLTEAYTYLRLMFARAGFPIMDSSHFSFNHPLGACQKCKGLGRDLELDITKLLDMEKSLNEGAIQVSDWSVGGRMWSIIKGTGYYDMDKKLKDFTEEELRRLLYAPAEYLESSEYIGNRWTYEGIVTRIKRRNTKVHRGPSESDLKYFSFVDCLECHGGRLKRESLEVLVEGKNIGEVADMSIADCLDYVKNVNHKNAAVIKPRLIEQLQGLIDVGVGYLSLNRSSDTLSGGEAQRVKMARQLGCDLIETVYVLDEPTAGLHPRDVDQMVSTLKKLRDAGNTVLVVEHDERVMRAADHIVEIGPGGGKLGGKIVAQGTFEEIIKSPESVTAPYLQKGDKSPQKRSYRTPTGTIHIKNATRHNLKNISINVPTGVLVALTGVSGSGKSSLVEEIIEQHSEKIILMDQSQVGNTKRGCIATYTGAFDHIRKIFARENGMSESLFSFNGKGACEECKGLGHLEMEMNFLGDVKMHCDACNGSRYKEKVLRYLYKGKNIAEILKMTAQEVKEFFDCEEIRERMQLLQDVGLDYIEMGQTLDTLSGGESQRLKLASRLQNRGEFYILDEPSSGLHFADIEKLMKLLNRLVDNGNTVLVIEHNLDIIAQADWIIDLGLEGGEKGGQVIAEGTPRDVAKNKKSITGRYLLL